MKKVFLYLIFFILIIFIAPALLTHRTEETSVNESQIEIQENQVVENTVEEKGKSGKKIKLLHNESNTVEEVNLEDYICNVVSAEMPADFEEEALKAQAIVARTYTIYKINHKKHDEADICDDSTCCQAWISKEDRLAKWEEDKRESNWNKIVKCVQATNGKIITYNNEPINAFFHSNSGGKTEIPKEVWGGDDYPYLQVVQTAGEEGYTQYSSEVTYTNDELINKLKEKYNDIKIDYSKKDSIKILEHTDSGRVKTIRFGNHELSGVETRTILGLKSTNFEVTQSNGKVLFNVKGYGHGVGMSQTGADSMAKAGKTAEEIIKHFYTDVEIKNSTEI